jgi:hypothetical protein
MNHSENARQLLSSAGTKLANSTEDLDENSWAHFCGGGIDRGHVHGGGCRPQARRIGQDDRQDDLAN